MIRKGVTVRCIRTFESKVSPNLDFGTIGRTYEVVRGGEGFIIITTPHGKMTVAVSRFEEVK